MGAQGSLRLGWPRTGADALADTLRAVAPYLIVLGLLFAGLENTRRARVGRRASWVIVAAEGLVAFFAAFALLAAVLMGLAFPEGLAGVDIRTARRRRRPGYPDLKRPVDTPQVRTS